MQILYLREKTSQNMKMIEIKTSSLKDISKSIGNYNAAKENNEIGMSVLANTTSEPKKMKENVA